MAFSFSFLIPFDCLLSVMEPTGRAVGGHFVFSLRASCTPRSKWMGYDKRLFVVCYEQSRA